MADHHQEAAEAEITELLANNPARKHILLHLQHHENNPAALARALPQNRYIATFRFYLDGMAANANFDLLLQEVAQRDVLQEVLLADDDDDRLPSIRSRPFLEAFQRNARIETVQFGLPASFRKRCCSCARQFILHFKFCD